MKREHDNGSESRDARESETIEPTKEENGIECVDEHVHEVVTRRVEPVKNEVERVR